MQALFGENVCENERIGSHRGVHLARPLDLPMIIIVIIEAQKKNNSREEKRLLIPIVKITIID